MNASLRRALVVSNQLRCQRLPRRTFGSTATRLVSSQQDWLLIIPDNDGMLEKRMEVRPKHLELIKPIVESGTIVFGGQYLGSPLKEGQPPQTKGSALLVRADTKEEAIKLVESDIYCDHNVWNTSKMQIHPFKSTDLTAL